MVKDSSKPLLRFIFYGSGPHGALVQFNPQFATEGLLEQRIMLSCRRDWKRFEDIADEAEVPTCYVADCVRRLALVGLVSEQAGTARSRIIVLSEDEARPCIDLAKKMCGMEAEIVRDQKPRLVEAVDELAKGDWTWAEMEAFLVCGWVVDCGVNAALHRTEFYPRPPERYLVVRGRGRWLLGRYYYWGIEGGSKARRGIGVNLYRGIGYVHSSYVRKPTPSFSSLEEDILEQLQRHPMGVKDLGARVGLDPGAVSGSAQLLREAGIVRECGGILEPNFPSFSEAEMSRLTSLVRDISDRIVEEVYLPMVPDARRLFRRMKMPCWEWGAFLCMLVHLVMGHSTDQLVHRRIIADLPRRTGAVWGMWGFQGKMTL